jgi:hypothetical protein
MIDLPQRISERCPECGAPQVNGLTCADHFHQLLGWELEYLLFDLHHLMVLCYHLQHPSLYSPETLTAAMGMLRDFVEQGISPQAMRERIQGRVDSGVRQHRIKGIPDAHGAYAHPVTWALTVADVVAAGLDAYYASVQAWAESVLAALRTSGNLSA